LSVDILLDASGSQYDRQKHVASQAYIIAESLTRCHIPVKVYSFRSEKEYTIINLFRDYNETDKNDKIFEYTASGSNRDGLAVRTALYMMKNSACEHKILIILSDGVPNDTEGIATEKSSHLKYDYIADAGIDDVAFEVRKGWHESIPVLCVFTGVEADLFAAKKILRAQFGVYQISGQVFGHSRSHDTKCT
jgi:nitric oxide reductase activation protein